MGRALAAQDISIPNSFNNLRTIVVSFEQVATGVELGPADRRRLVRVVLSLGAVVVPLLSRKLRASEEREASWAYYLLACLGGERAADVARKLALDGTASDDQKALALALLSELGAELPAAVVLADPEGLRQASVRDLVASLRDPTDVARAAALIVEQVEPDELVAFMADLAQAGGSSIAPLVEELLLRDDVPPSVRIDLAELLRELGAPSTSPTPQPPPGFAVAVGERADGTRVVLAAGRRERRSVPRLRTLEIEIDPTGCLQTARYVHDAPPRAGLRRLAKKAERSGFVVSHAPRARAAQLVGAAARSCRRAGTRLPPDFYLGRDLVGLYDEHVSGRRRSRANDLDAGVEHLARGHTRRARTRLERYVAAHPEDPEGRTQLGECLFDLGETDAGIRHFAAAARLASDDPLAYWNLAHAAKRADKPGACYLALIEYLRARDRRHGAKERARDARDYMKVFEDLIRHEHPTVTPQLFARGEELFDRACEHVEAQRFDDAVTTFEAVLKLVPSHYAAWGNLAVAYLGLGRHDDAERCLEKALELRPDYEPARHNLHALRQR